MPRYQDDWDDEEDELNVRIRRHDGRSASPAYAPDFRRPIISRPVYTTPGGYLIPAEERLRRRSSSHSHRPDPIPPPPVAPVVINNRIYNHDEDEVYLDDRYDPRSHYLNSSPPRRQHRSHSHSRSRPPSFAAPAQDSYETEKIRKELEAYKLREESEREMERIKKELELKKLKEDQRKKEEDARAEAERKEAIEKYKAEEVKRLEKEKKEKDEREKEYKLRLEEDLRKSGMDEDQIAVVLKKEGAKKPQQALEPARPTYTRMSRRHLSIETLNVHRIEYEFDVDPDYVLIKRWVPEYEQDFLWKHTRELREHRYHHHPEAVEYAIEGKKKHHSEPEFEFVRKKEKRRPSPSPLLTFLAGGKR